MFILSGLFVEDGENLFREFWSPFGISFLFLHVRIIKKKETDFGPYPSGTPRAGPYKPPPPVPPAHPAVPPETLSLAAAAGRHPVADPPPAPPRRSRPPPPPSPEPPEVAAPLPPVFFEKLYSFFKNRGLFFIYFLIFFSV